MLFTENKQMQKLEITYMSKNRVLVHLSSAPLKNRSQDKISDTRDLLGQMPVRENGESHQTTMQVSPMWGERGKEGSLGGRILQSSTADWFRYGW